MKTAQAKDGADRSGDSVQGNDGENMPWIMRRIIHAGCLAMVFMQATGGAHRTEFFRLLGASEFHFGVIGAIPPALLFLQFISALIENHLHFRKWIWIVLMSVRRGLFVLIAMLFALALGVLQLDPVALITGFIVGQMALVFTGTRTTD